MPPRWVRFEVEPTKRVKLRRRAMGGCTCLTKDLYPADWGRFLLPWLLCLGFAALFAWVRGFSWLVASVNGRATLSVGLVCEWVFLVSWALCVWSLGVVHYRSPGFLPLGLTARSLAIDLVALKRGEGESLPAGSASSQFHWEMKKYGKRAGELRTCKRSPAVDVAPLGTSERSKICPAKPDRAHFCPFTGRAVLEMDHYCPWLGNCIGYGTRKPFLLVLWHGLAMGMALVGACSWDVAVTFTSGPRLLAGLPLVVGLLLGMGSLFLIGLFMSYHGSLALHNYTTIEKHEKVSAPSTFRVQSAGTDFASVFKLGSAHSGFVPAVQQRVPAGKEDRRGLKGKDRPFVYFWMQWAYSPSPWSHGTLSNLVHYLGNGLLWPVPVSLGVQQWHPWSVAVRPKDSDTVKTLSKPAAGSDMGGHDVPTEPVGVTSASLAKREAMLDAAPILASRMR